MYPKPKNCKIDHYLNSGKETRVLGFQVDGFDSISQTFFQFQGCYYHGHDCQQPSERKKTKRENTEKIRKFSSRQAIQSSRNMNANTKKIGKMIQM